jgi:hypothetical protein
MGYNETRVYTQSASGYYTLSNLIYPQKKCGKKLSFRATLPHPPPHIVFCCQERGWMNIEVFFELMDHVSAEIYARQKGAVSFRWPLKSHPALLQLKLHEYMDYLTVVASHCTHQMQPPNAAIVRPLDTQHTWVFLLQQN